MTSSKGVRSEPSCRAESRHPDKFLFAGASSPRFLDLWRKCACAIADMHLCLAPYYRRPQGRPCFIFDSLHVADVAPGPSLCTAHFAHAPTNTVVTGPAILCGGASPSCPDPHSAGGISSALLCLPARQRASPGGSPPILGDRS
jgi:hypothetical protein